MNIDLIDGFGLGPRELVAFTGGGGKTTLLLELARQLEQRDDRVLVTTTTKMGLDQTEGRAVCWSPSSDDVNGALVESSSLMVLSDADDHKVLGYPPAQVDTWFAETAADYVLVEADGARRHPLKAPAGHEPVIPSSASIVVVVVGVNAIGQTVERAVHRPQQATELTGLSSTAVVTPSVVATIVSHPRGGLQGVPEAARLVVAINRVEPTSEAEAAALRDLLLKETRIHSVVIVPFTENW